MANTLGDLAQGTKRVIQFALELSLRRLRLYIDARDADTSAAVNAAERSAKSYTDIKVDDEHVRAHEAEQALQAAISSINDKLPAEASSENPLADKEYVDAQVATEKTRAEGAESTLEGKIAAEKNRAQGAENNLQQAINTEASRAAEAERVLDGKIAAEKTRAEGAEGALQALIQQVSAALANYYLKTETYSKAEVNTIVDAIKQFRYEVAAELPTASADTMGIIYLIPSTNPKTQNIKDEFITVLDGSTYKWEQIGSTTVDLSGYSTTAEMNTAIATALASYYTKSEVDEALGGKQNTIDDLANIRSGAQAGSTAVQPSTLNDVVKNTVAESGVYDVSANNDNTKFESLSALLRSANLNTLIPTDIRKGGMSIKFVQSSDNKYVQYRYMETDATTAATFINAANWQGVDDEPTDGSDNLVKSGGVYDALLSLGIEMAPFIQNVSKGVINYSTGAYISNSSYLCYTIKNIGYTLITVEAGFDRYATNSAVIAYYSSEQIAENYYLGNDSIKGNNGVIKYVGIIPPSCKTIAISNKTTTLSYPTITAYVSAEKAINDCYKKLYGDTFEDNKGLNAQFNEVDSPSHLMTDYIPCNNGDNVVVVFGEAADYDFCSVIYDSSKNPLKYYRNISSSGVREFTIPEQGKFIRCSILKSGNAASSIILNGVSVWNIVRNSISSLNAFRFDTANYIHKTDDKFVELNDTGDITRCEQEKQALLAGLSQKVGNYHTATPQKFFCLAHITDSHMSPENLKRAINMLKSEDFSDIDVLVHTGDCGEDYKDSNEAKHREFLNEYVGNKPLLFSMGNHDCAGIGNMGTDTRQDIIDYWFDYLHNANFSGVTIGSGKSYYYYDNTTYKVRVIVLNDFEWLYEGMQFAFATNGNGSRVCYTQEQISWFCNTLNSVPEDYTVIIAKHTYDNGFTYGSSDWTCPYYRGYTENGERFHIMRQRDSQKGRIIEDILHAYITHGSINETYTFDEEVIKENVQDIVVNADFSSAKGTFAFMCYGHIHRDGICADSIYSGIYGVSCAGSDAKTAGNDNIGRTPSGKCANLLNLYVLRTDIRKVYVIRIGADFTQDGIKKTYTSFSY